MKRYILYSAAVLLVFTTSCERDCEVIKDKPGANRMEVNVTLDGVKPTATKAQIPDIDLDARGITIAGYYTEAGVDPGSSKPIPGFFGSRIDVATPNVFNLEEISAGVFYPPVRTLKKDDTGKYHVLLSKWALSADSYLSYVAWAVDCDAAVGAAGNPITSAPQAGTVGQPVLKYVLDGKTDVVAASSIDNQNNVVRGALDLDFKHILSKLRFSAISKSGTMTIKSVKLNTTKAVLSSSTYSFATLNDTYAGTWNESAASSAAASYTLELGADVVVGSESATYLGERLAIPQTVAAGDYTVEVVYQIANGTTVTSYTRSVRLPAQTLLQNTSYNYIIELSADKIDIGRCSIGKWIYSESALLPQVAGPRGDVILLLDGSVPPYTAPDGTQYVLDHSGYNNHCKISGSVGYDSVLKCYVFTNGATEKGSILVPGLGNYTGGGMTVELVAKTWTLTKNQVFSFMNAGNRQLFSHYISDYSATYWDAGGIANTGSTLGSRMSFANIASHFNQISLMSYTYDASGVSKYQHVMRNMQKMKMYSDFTSVHNSFNLTEGGTLGYTFEGAIHQLKIIKKAKRAVDPAELKALAKKFNFTYDSYVQDGLLIDLEGETSPSTHAGNSVWVDNSPNGNHAYYNADAAVSGIYHDPTYKCYAFSGKGFMQFIKSIGNNTNNMTLEVVVKSQNASGAIAGGCVVQFNTLLDDASGTATAYQNRGGIYWPNASSVLLEAAHTDNAGSGSSGRRFNESHTDLLNLYGINVASKASISLVREGNSLSFRHNGKESGLGTRTNPVALPKWTVGRVGGQSYGSNANYTGSIYAIRLYNRVLTDEERKANYELDKKLYNL